MGEIFQDRLELHRISLEARSRNDSFFERLAILDGGTVALITTAVLGPFRGNSPHKHLVAVGLTLLVLATVVLLLRNGLAARLEFYIVARTGNAGMLPDPRLKRNESRLERAIRKLQFAGITFSAVGVLLLLTEVWLIL